MNIIGLVLFAVIAVTQDVRAQIDTRAQNDTRAQIDTRARTNTLDELLTFGFLSKAAAGNYSENDLTAAGVDLTNLNYIIFYTRGKGAAHVLLQKDRDVFDTNVVEIVIGADGNTKSYIRDASGTNRAIKKGKVLPSKKFGSFWARWNGKCIWVGRGKRVGARQKMQWCGLTHTLDYVSAYYGAGDEGVFKFFKTATELTFSCEYSDTVNYDQFDLYADGVDISSTTSVVFATAGRNDAHILLMQDNGVYDDNAVEVILGGSCNKMSMIRNVGDDYTVATSYERGILSSKIARYFWISWANDCVRVGKGYIVGKDGLMSDCSLSLTANYIAISYGNGSEGYFMFARTP